MNEDGSTVVVLTSSAEETQEFSVTFDRTELGDASAWVTNNDNTFEETTVEMSGSDVGAMAPGRSVITIKVLP